MRIAVLLAASLLVAGCGADSGSRPGATRLTPITPSHSASQSTSVSTPRTTPTTVATAPGSGAGAGEAIAWVEAGPPVDAAGFHIALRAGTTTELGDDVAFTTPSGISCMTDVTRTASGLACLVDLADPPPQPPDVYGVWKGGWVDFDAAGVRVGSAHADPGRFAAGMGAPLPAGGSLSFGDFRCRADSETLICVNYARQTAVRYADSGVQAFGCTRQSPPVAGVGIQYGC